MSTPRAGWPRLEWAVLALLACGGQAKVDTGGVTPPTVTDADADADADADVETTDEPDWLTLCVNELLPDNGGSLEVDGTEPDWLELHNPGLEPVDLLGWSVSDDAAEPTKHTFQESLVVPPGGFVVLLADGAPEEGPEHLGFRLSADGEVVVLRDPWAHQSVVRYGAMSTDIAAARVTDCCEGACWEFVQGGTPGSTNDIPDPPVRVDEAVVDVGGTWRWQSAESGPGDGWSGLGFDDASWGEGPGPLGYGDAHIVTALPYGPDAGDKWPAAYFRHAVLVTDAEQVGELVLTLLRDDGAVVWLNGTELFRTGMPGGEITHETFADVTMGGADETTYAEWIVPADALREGENVLAVEVHQANSSSSDLGFDLTLTLVRWVPAD